jgi:hypothetical protein
MSRSGQKREYSQVIAMRSVLFLLSISLVNPSQIIRNILAQDEELTATELYQPLEDEDTAMNSTLALESASSTKNNGLVRNDVKEGATDATHSNLPTMPSIANLDLSNSNIDQSVTAFQQQHQAQSEEYVFVHEFAPDKQFGNPDITIDGQTGNIFVADYFNNRVIKFDATGNVITQWGSGGSGDGQFHNPQDVAIDSVGNLYVTDTNNHRIQKFNNNGQFILKWGSFGSGDGQLGFPSRLAIDSNDIIYVTEPDNGRIQKFNTVGQFVGKIAEGQLSFPVGIDVDSSDNVYVAESGASGNPSRVDKFTSSGQFITGKFSQEYEKAMTDEEEQKVINEYWGSLDSAGGGGGGWFGKPDLRHHNNKQFFILTAGPIFVWNSSEACRDDTDLHSHSTLPIEVSWSPIDVPRLLLIVYVSETTQHFRVILICVNNYNVGIICDHI